MNRMESIVMWEVQLISSSGDSRHESARERRPYCNPSKITTSTLAAVQPAGEYYSSFRRDEPNRDL